MSCVTPADELSHCYLMALDFTVKVSILDSTNIEKLRQRFISEAQRIGSEDTDALVWQIFSRICEVHLNEALEFEREHPR